MVIRAGGVNLTRPAIIFDTTEYYNHPLYNEDMQRIVQPHDIGVIKFNRFVEYTGRYLFLTKSLYYKVYNNTIVKDTNFEIIAPVNFTFFFLVINLDTTFIIMVRYCKKKRKMFRAQTS